MTALPLKVDDKLHPCRDRAILTENLKLFAGESEKGAGGHSAFCRGP
jgi:hypothetical protein